MILDGDSCSQADGAVVLFSSSRHVVERDCTGGPWLTGATQVAAGTEHLCYLTATAVNCVGENGGSQLGDGGIRDSHTVPVVTRMGSHSLLDAQDDTTCVAEGTDVYCWGLNAYSQTGDNLARTSRPYRTRLPAPVIALDVGRYSTCVALASGAVSCWGTKHYGLFGNGAGTDNTSGTASSRTPVAAMVTGAVEIQSSENARCARLGTGQIQCWGHNDDGQLGNDMTRFSNRPVDVVGIDDAIDMAVGARFGCALRSDLSVWCWGDRPSDAGGSQPRPVLIDSFPPVVEITATNDPGAESSHLCGRTAGGEVWCAHFGNPPRPLSPP